MEYHKRQDHQRQIPDVAAAPKMIGRKVVDQEGRSWTGGVQ